MSESLMKKELIFKDDLRTYILEGMRQLVGTLEVTLGPGGRNVLIDRKYRAPDIYSDGASIAKEITLSNKYLNLIVRTLTETSRQTNLDVGDGTTTSSILAREIIEHAINNVPEENHMQFIKDLNNALPLIIGQLYSYVKQIDPEDDYLENVASLSAHDKDMGYVVADVMRRVGVEGIVNVTAGSKPDEYDYSLQDGLSLPSGYTSSRFLLDHKDTKVRLENPYVLVIGEVLDLRGMKELEVVFNEISRKTKRPLLVITHGITNDIVDIFVVNSKSGNLVNCVVRTPGVGDGREKLGEDIALVTGASMLKGDFTGITMDKFGSCDSAIISRDKTEIINGHGDKENVISVVEGLKRLSKEATSEFDKTNYRTRIANLTQSVATIEIGHTTETELIEKNQRIEDSLCATQAAMRYGVVPGGGITLRNVGLSFKRIDEPIQTEGMLVIANALLKPLEIICKNAGYDPAKVEYEIKHNEASCGDIKPEVFGFNAETGEYGDLYELGVIDPVKVLECAIRNAVKVASLLLNTSVAIINDEEVK